MVKLNKKFASLAKKASSVAGKPATLSIALMVVIVWAATGPFMGFSDTWQLLINTTTTIVTFLLAVSIQYTQNRDAKALHLKLNKILDHYDDLEEVLDQIEKKLELEEDA